MQVIEIKKHITNGFKIGYIILEGIHSQEEMEEQVEDWCYAEPNGHGNGWTSKWREITDEEHRSEIIAKEIIKIDKNIIALEDRKKFLLGGITVSFVQLKCE